MPPCIGKWCRRCFATALHTSSISRHGTSFDMIVAETTYGLMVQDAINLHAAVRSLRDDWARCSQSIAYHPSTSLSCRPVRRQRTFSIILCRNEIGLVSARMTAWSAGQCLDDVFLMIGHLTSFQQKSLIKLMSANERGLGHQNEHIYYIQ